MIAEKGDLFDDFHGIIFTCPLSTFCEYNDNDNNVMVSCIEYLYIRYCLWISLRKHHLQHNLLNGYKMSDCFNMNLHKKYVSK